MPLRFHSLLYLSDAASSRDAPNLRSARSPEQRIVDYLRMAARLGSGIERHFGRPLTLVTNRAERLQQLVAEQQRDEPSFGRAMELQEISFGSALPPAARFHAAAHKLYVLEHLARQPDAACLLDLDIVCQRPFPADVVERIARGQALVYDISDQAFAAYGFERVRHDLERVAGVALPEARWYGGEFIAGPPAFFATLFAEIEPLLGAYAEQWAALHHQGDEIVVSAALNRLRPRHGEDWLADVAALGAVRRHWGVPTAHDAMRFGDASRRLSFVHLPAMKSLLASRRSDESILRLLRRLDRHPLRWTKRLMPLLARLG